MSLPNPMAQAVLSVKVGKVRKTNKRDNKTKQREDFRWEKEKGRLPVNAWRFQSY